MNILFIIIISYLLGSFPTSIIVGRILKGIDIRNYGSENAGATNTFRVLGWKAGMLVLLVDMAKGLLAVTLITKYFGDPKEMGRFADLSPIIAGSAVILGHIYTAFARFKGGKGVGTATGVIIGIAPLTSLVCILIWLMIVLTTRFVSVASLAAACCFPLITLLRKDFDLPLLIFSVLLPLVIVYTHRENIRRLFKGEENRLRKGWLSFK
ncbi:glycerol-3-phosphate 1-O-acyltransferase PlsY [candidate division KSB1 bacterium]|nr:glycerol-3-phosphate 1-O-acyltransferase PlsY [candidate division KSB1 bacterium]